MSEQVLRSIERTLKAERRKEYERDIAENNDRDAAERTGNEFYANGGFTDVSADIGTAGAEGDRNIRENAAGISERTSQGVVSVAASERNAGYDKTDFEIHAVIDGENYDYDGRFDIGDGNGAGSGETVTEHIRKSADFIVKSDLWFYTDESKAASQNTLNILVPFLNKYTELSAEEEKILEKFKAENPIRGKAMSELTAGDVIKLPSETMLDRNMKPAAVSESYAVVKTANEREISLDTYSDKELTNKTGVAGYLNNWGKHLDEIGAEYIGRYEDLAVKKEKTAENSETSQERRTAAFEKLKANHDFSPDAIKFLDRIEIQMNVNSFDTFDLQILDYPIFILNTI